MRNLASYLRLLNVQKLLVGSTRLALLVFFVVSLVLAGCGGGGGASSGLYKFSYRVNFTTPDGNSIVVRLQDDLSRAVNQLTLNRGVSSQLDFTELKPGRYQILASLYSGSSGAGTKVGELNTWVTLTDNTLLDVAVGGTVQNITTTGMSSIVSLPETKQVFPAALDSSGRMMFSPPGSFTFTVLGGVGSVSSTGLFQSTSVGSGFVRANHTPSGKTGVAGVTVQSSIPSVAKWNVLVFLNAANDLNTFSEPNVRQMLKVSDNTNVRFILQWKQAYLPSAGSSNPTFTGTKRVVLGANSTINLVQDLANSIDMGDKDALRDFIAWAKTYYPAQKTCLVLWNHGNGWSRGKQITVASRGVSYDSETGNHIDTWDLDYALGPDTLDIVAFDSSLMQMMEVLYQIKGKAKLVVGSEESPPATGYPYDLCFKPMRDNPDQADALIAKGLVDGMAAAYGTSAVANLTQSVVDTSKLDSLKSALDGLSAVLQANASSIGSAVVTARAQSRKYEPELTGRYYYDIDEVCNNLKLNLSTFPSIVSNCDAVKAALAQAVLYNTNNANSANSKGLAFDFSPKQYFTTYASDYANLRFAQQGDWDDWLGVAP